MLLTAIPLVLSERTIRHSVADVFLAHAPSSAAINRPVATHVALELVRLVETVHMAVAAPVVRDAAPGVAHEPGTRWVLLPLLGLNHLVVADTLVRISRLAEQVALEIVGQVQVEDIKEKATTTHRFCLWEDGEDNEQRLS